MRYRKKPVVIEAVRWRMNINDLYAAPWLIDAINKREVFLDLKELKIKTLEGIMTVGNGDYIIQGVKGELYPCKPDIFEATYEPVDQPPESKGEE